MKPGVELDDLKQMRDELRLQAHLFTADLKKQWEELEKDWHIVARNIKSMNPTLNKAMATMAAAANPLVKELREGYGRIKQQLNENRD